MRVLIVSFAFPPSRIIGAIRVGKTAKYLHRFGHDVRVVAGRDPPYETGAEMEIASGHVSEAPWVNVDAPYEWVLKTVHASRSFLRRNHAPTHQAPWVNSAWDRLHGSGGEPKTTRRMAERVRLAYQDLFHLPDSSIGWFPSALREARRIAKQFRPDVIFASAAPTTCLLVARKLSRETGVPWVGDLRDLWADNHYNEGSRLRKSVDQWIERKTLRSASALVTVSEPLADTLRAKYDVPVSVVLNGFDPEDIEDAEGEEVVASSPGLELLHSGTVLAQRDPSPLFDALKLMGDAGRDVRVVFLGPNGPDIRNHLRRLASERGVTDQLVFRDTVPHVDALRLQRRADVLLLLMWNNPLERGVYTGKLFSYIGARRPIFSVGMSDGVAADLIREHQLGFAVDTPAAIAQQLSLWLEEKRIHGRLAAPKCANVDEFTREAQTRKLEQVLLSVVARTAAHHVTS